MTCLVRLHTLSYNVVISLQQSITTIDFCHDNDTVCIHAFVEIIICFVNCSNIAIAKFRHAYIKVEPDNLKQLFTTTENFHSLRTTTC